MKKEMLEIDELFPLLEQCMLLEEAEEGLRQRGQPDLARKLSKLQEDAGVQISMNHEEYIAEVAKGTPEVAVLNNAFEGIDRKRLNGVLQEVTRSFNSVNLKDDKGILLGRQLTGMLKEMNIPMPTTQAKTKNFAPK
jgi:hypothetical protein